MAYISLVHKKSGTVQQIQDSNAPTFETHEDFEWDKEYVLEFAQKYKVGEEIIELLQKMKPKRNREN